jgi:hypothetical protein
MKKVFFVGAIYVTVQAVLGSITLIFTFQWVDAVNMAYLFGLGIVMAIVDIPQGIPITLPLVKDMTRWIGKYANILTRFTGKGLCYIFSGSTLLASLCNNFKWELSTSVSTFLYFVAALMDFAVILVGLYSLLQGCFQSEKLRKAQENLLKQNVLEREWTRFAPDRNGMTKPGFQSLVSQYGNGVQFEDYQLNIIFEALGSTPAWRQPTADSTVPSNSLPPEPTLTLEELTYWVKGPKVWI